MSAINIKNIRLGHFSSSPIWEDRLIPVLRAVGPCARITAVRPRDCTELRGYLGVEKEEMRPVG